MSANKIAGFGGLIFPLLISLSELPFQCVLGFGRFVRMLKGSMNRVERDYYFQRTSELGFV